MEGCSAPGRDHWHRKPEPCGRVPWDMYHHVISTIRHRFSIIVPANIQANRDLFWNPFSREVLMFKDLDFQTNEITHNALKCVLSEYLCILIPHWAISFTWQHILYGAYLSTAGKRMQKVRSTSFYQGKESHQDKIYQ